MKKAQENPTPVNVAVSSLNAAECNVHRPSKKNDEAFKELVESIKAGGIGQRIIVRRTDNGALEVIDGHRRLEAAIALKYVSVPCDVYESMTEGEAQAKMIALNIQRIENDPLREAECIKRLADKGKTFEQIAATLGKDTGYVARRARIINLTDAWRRWLDENLADADLVEMVARHEQTLQDAVYEDLDIACNGEVDEDDIERAFDRALKSIDDETAFDTEECKTCTNNTATHGYLFAEEFDRCGRCQNAECYIKKWNDVVDAEIEKLREKKVVVKEVSQKWNIPNNWSTTRKKTKKNTVPYVYLEGKLKYLVWAEKSETAKAADARTEDEKEAERKIKRDHLAWSRNRRSAYGKIRTMLNDVKTRQEIVKAAVKTKRFAEWAEKKLLNDYETYVYDSNCQDAFEFLGNEVISDNGQTLTPEEVDALKSEDPAKKED